MSSVIFKLNRHGEMRRLSQSVKNCYSTVTSRTFSAGNQARTWQLWSSTSSHSNNNHNHNNNNNKNSTALYHRYQINRGLQPSSIGLWSQRRYLSSEQKRTSLKAYVDAPYSYSYGRSDQQLSYKTIGQLLNERVANESLSGKPFIISHHEGIKKTFAEFNDDVNRVAKAMYEQLGLRRGDVAGLWSCNTYKWITIQYACARLGVILCTVNPVYRVPELDYVLRKGDIKALFLPGKNSKQEIVNNYKKIIAETLNQKDETSGKNILEHIITIDGDQFESSDIPSDKKIELHTLDQLMQNNGDIASSITDQVQPDDPLMIMFTSGTTGKPKGAYLSHFTTANNVILVSNGLGEITDDLAFCIPLPFFHSFAGVLGNIAMVACPFQIIIPCLKYDVRQLVESMEQNNATHIMATPTLVIDLLNHLKKTKIQLPKLRGVLAGGASVPIDVAQHFVETVPSCVDFRIGYGATELGPCTTACRPEDSFERRTETVGSPLDFVEIKIINPETKCVVKLGETGEIHSRGHNVMLGYWKDPVKTQETIDHAGWYNTGDLGVMDKEGFLKIIGRTKEMIIVGGENVYPRELEELLHTHPEISDVHVIGVPDERKGEEICAWIHLANPNAKVTEEDIKQFCKDKISYFKVPRYVMFVDSFPTTPTGKTQKFIMREISCKKLNLKENK